MTWNSDTIWLWEYIGIAIWSMSCMQFSNFQLPRISDKSWLNKTKRTILRIPFYLFVRVTGIEKIWTELEWTWLASKLCMWWEIQIFHLLSLEPSFLGYATNYILITRREIMSILTQSMRKLKTPFLIPILQELCWCSVIY